MRGFSFPIFFSCYNLKSVTIPEGVTHISYLTFNDWRNLATVNLPKTLTFIGESSFKDISMKRLKSGWTSPKIFDYEAFTNPEDIENCGPDGYPDLYQKDDYWERFKKIIP